MFLFLTVERHTVRVEYFTLEHNPITWPGLEPRPLDPDPIALTIRSTRLRPVIESRQHHSFFRNLLLKSFFFFFKFWVESLARLNCLV